MQTRPVSATNAAAFLAPKPPASERVLAAPADTLAAPITSSEPLLPTSAKLPAVGPLFGRGNYAWPQSMKALSPENTPAFVSDQAGGLLTLHLGEGTTRLSTSALVHRGMHTSDGTGSLVRDGQRVYLVTEYKRRDDGPNHDVFEVGRIGASGRLMLSPDYELRVCRQSSPFRPKAEYFGFAPTELFAVLSPKGGQRFTIDPWGNGFRTGFELFGVASAKLDAFKIEQFRFRDEHRSITAHMEWRLQTLGSAARDRTLLPTAREEAERLAFNALTSQLATATLVGNAEYAVTSIGITAPHVLEAMAARVHSDVKAVLDGTIERLPFTAVDYFAFLATRPQTRNAGLAAAMVTLARQARGANLHDFSPSDSIVGWAAEDSMREALVALERHGDATQLPFVHALAERTQAMLDSKGTERHKARFRGLLETIRRTLAALGTRDEGPAIVVGGRVIGADLLA